MLLLMGEFSFAQTNLVAELNVFSPNNNAWNTIGAATISSGEALLTPAQQNQAGAIYYNQPYSIASCRRFRVRFEYLMTGGQTFTENGITSTGDGIAFWFLENPPTTNSPGSNLGMPNTGPSVNNRGLKVGLDIFDNDSARNNPAVMAFFGGNFQEGDGKEVSVQVPGLRSNNYQAAEIFWDNGLLTVDIAGQTVLSQVITSYDNAQSISRGYFGFSASTGLATDNQQIRNIQLFIDAIPVKDVVLNGCYNDDTFTTGGFDLTSVRNQIATSGNFSYYNTFDDASRSLNPIADPKNYIGNDNEDIYVRVTNTEGCFSIATLTLKINPVRAIVQDTPSSVCADKEIQLDGTASIGTNLTYEWTTTGGNLISGQNSSIVTVRGKGRYYLTVTSGICQHTYEVIITNNQVTPRIEIATPGVLSCLEPQIQIDASATEEGPTITYQWWTPDGNIVSGQGTRIITVDRPGVYHLTANDSREKCSNVLGVKVTQSADLPLSSFVLPSLKTCREFEVVLDGSASSSGDDFTYEWTATEGGVIVSGGNTNMATVSAEGMYTLIVTNTSNGCATPFSQRLVSDRTKPEARIALPEQLSCTNPTLLLDGLASSRGANLVYTWSASNGGEISGDNTGLTLEVSKPGTYMLNVTNSVTGCFDEATVEVLADPTAIIIDLPAEATLSCVGNTTLDASGSSTGNGLVFLWTTEDGIITGSTNQLKTTVSQPGIYRLTISNPALNCERYQEITVVLDNSIPVVQPFYRLEACSLENRTGFASFNLRSKDEEIKNGNSNWSVNYYLSDADAQNRRNRLPDNYTNTTSPIQVVYVRVENIDTQCYAISNLDLVVNPLPSPRITEPHQECDDDADGFAIFNFDEITLKIIDNDPEVTLTYHDTFENAQANRFPLPTVYANITKDRQTVYVRAFNTRTSCFKISPLVLEALAAPQINYEVKNIEICDEDNDGYTYFNLTDREQDVLKNLVQQNTQVHFFTTLANAESGLSAIVDVTNFRNTVANRQTIWARATNTVTDCYRTTFFDIVVNPLPQLQVLDPVQICDNGVNLKDGMATFDLTDATSAIVNNELGYQVRLYTSQIAAENGGNDFVNEASYVNTINPQVLYARVTHQVTECVNYGDITLRVLPNPSPEIPTALEVCDINNTGDGIEIFDLTKKEEQIINQEGGITLTYFTSEVDAEFNQNPILNPQTFTNTQRDSQTLYVRATNNVTACYSVVPMIIVVNPLPESNQIENLLVCGRVGANNGVFDLNTHANTILAGLNSPLEYRITYYLNEQDATDNVRQLPDLYNSTGLAQTIWVRVEHRDSECFKTYSFDLLVGEEVVLETPTTRMIQCGNLVNGLRTATFNLTDFQENILNGINPNEVTIKYFETESSGKLSNEILTPTNYTNIAHPQNIYVQVTRNQLPNCNAFVSFALQVNLNPVPVLAQNSPICMNSRTNQAVSPITLNAGLPLATHDFIWEQNGVVLPNETKSTLQALQPGDYRVTAINKGTLCQGEATTTVIPFFEPQTSVNYLNGPFTGKGSVEVVSDSPERYTYSLDGAQQQTSPLFENLEAGMHQIVVTDIIGCGTQTLTFVITDYMRYFTPNGDGYNEDWKVLGLEEHPEAEVHIFDRHGKLIKGMRADEKWNGTFNGYALPANDYWFTVQYVDNGKSIVYKSHFTLKR